MIFRVIRDHLVPEFTVVDCCRVLKVSTSGYYGWRKAPVGKRQARRAELVEQIRSVHEAGRRVYGAPRVHRALLATGVKRNRKTVARIMREEGIRSKVKRKFRVRTTDSDHPHPVAPNVLDLCSRRIVGWSMAPHLRAELVRDALAMATTQRDPAPGLIHHSDRGVQYCCGEYRAELEAWGMTASMSRAGDCYDNAPKESFWATLKKELMSDREFATRAEARAAIFEYIEVFYNRQRIHSSLGYVSPEQFEAGRR